MPSAVQINTNHTNIASKNIINISSSVNNNNIETTINNTHIDIKMTSHAISTFELDAWMKNTIQANEVKQNKNVGKKSKYYKEVHNEIFTTIMAVLTDDFWIEKFELASKGKFPRGFSCQNSILTYKKGNKTSSVDLSPQSLLTKKYFANTTKINSTRGGARRGSRANGTNSSNTSSNTSTNDTNDNINGTDDMSNNSSENSSANLSSNNAGNLMHINEKDLHKEIANMAIEFFKLHGGIFSPTDSDAFDDSVASEYTSWGDISNKMQECLLSLYFTDIPTQMRLTAAETANLKQIVRLGITNKYFGKHNIHLENNRIYRIDGLQWDDDSRRFCIDPNLKPVSRSYNRKKTTALKIDPNEKDMIPYFNFKWEKYLDILSTRIENDNRSIRKVIIHRQTTDQASKDKYSDMSSDCIHIVSRESEYNDDFCYDDI